MWHLPSYVSFRIVDNIVSKLQNSLWANGGLNWGLGFKFWIRHPIQPLLDAHVTLQGTYAQLIEAVKGTIESYW